MKKQLIYITHTTKLSFLYKALLIVFIISLAITTVFMPGLQKTANAAVARQNSTTCATTAAATSVACTVTTPTNGNRLIAVVGTRGTTTGRVSSITQTGATWSRAAEVANANGVTQEVWYTNEVSSAGTTVTVNLAASLKAAVVIAEYSGIDSSTPVDLNSNATGSSTTISTGTTGTTSQADQVWIGGISIVNTDAYGTYTGSFSSVGTTVTTTGTAANQVRIGMAERIVSSTGTAGTTNTIATARQYAGVVVTFNAKPVPTKVAFSTAARTLTAGTCSGASNIITIQLQDAGNTPRNPTGTTVIRITSDSPSETYYSDSSCTTQITNGDITFTSSENTKSFYVIDTRKSNTTWTFTAAKQSGPETLTNGTQAYTVNAAATSRLQITLPGQTFTDGTGNSGTVTNQTAGGSFTITSISATDAYNNITTGYSGAKTLAYSGPGNAPSGTNPSYTTSISFTNGVSTTTLTTTLYNAQSTTITVTDGGSYGYASSSVTVDPGAIHNYAVSATTPNIAGACVTGNTITARDQWNNTRTTDATVVNMTTSGSGVTFYTAAGCGTSTTQYTMSSGSANFFFRTNLKQSGITISATKVSDTPTGTSGTIDINPSTVNRLLIRLPGQSFVEGTGITGSTNFTGLRTPNATAGTSFTVDVKAVDAYNNLVDSGPNNYTGSKTISWAGSTSGNAPSGQAPSFPGSVTFTNGAADGLTITYYNANSNRTVLANDSATPVSGTVSSLFDVQSNTINNYKLTNSSPISTIGSTDNDYATSIIHTSDFGYAITGTLRFLGAGGNDMFIAKYDSSGNLSWNKTWGGTGTEYGNSIVQTSDGGYAITGQTNSYGAGLYDMFIAKYDSSGNLSWDKTWGGTTTDNGESIVQTSDGGYIITGGTTSFGVSGSYDMFIAKYDSSGNLSWDKTWGDTGTELGYSVVQTSDGGYAVVGDTTSFGAGNGDMFIAKYDSSGNLSWDKTWGDTGNENGNSIVQTSDGGYAVVGDTTSFGAGSGDMFIAKYDSSGNLSWDKTWGDTGTEYGNAIVQTTDNGYAITGQTNSYGAGLLDIFIAKFNSSGDELWSKTWGGASNENGNAIVQTTDNGYAITGQTNSYGAGSGDIFIAKYTSSGNIYGCDTNICQNQNVTENTPTATENTPTATENTPTATENTPTVIYYNPNTTTLSLLSPVAGIPFGVSVYARDQWQNQLGSLYSAPVGTYAWTSTATNAPDSTAPSIGTLAQGDFTNGVATKSVILYKAESGVTFTATEPGPGSTGTSSAVLINPGNVSAASGDSTITGSSVTTTDNPVVVTITLRDTWRNPINNISAANIVVSATGGPTINQPVSNTDANGQTTADLTWATAGARAVSVQINSISLVQNDGSTPDVDGYLDDTLAVTVNPPAADARIRGGTTIRGGTRIQ